MSTPCVDGDRVYGLGKDGTVVCLRTSNGKLIWKKSLLKDFDLAPPGYGWASSPVVEEKLLLLSASFAGLALDKMTGTLVWKSSPTKPESMSTSGAAHYSTPVVCDFDGKRCGLFYGQMMLSAVDLATWERVWSFLHFAAHPISDPIVSGTRIFLSNPPKTLLMEMAPGSPKTVWTNSDLLTAPLTSVLVDGFVYCSNKGPFPFPNLAWDVYEEASVPVRCVELATGKVMWESAQKMPLSQPCAAAGKLILLDVKGTLRIVEASPVEYREISSADVLGGANRPRRFAVPPVLCGGRIYCRNYAGDLVCIDVSK
jgi:outer membrane protein assembly factor BamB